MATPLHDADVLVALAESGPGAARDWASVRLALFAPERFRHLPEDEWDAATCIAVGAPGVLDRVLERLRARADEPATAVLADLVAVWGLLPEDTGPWIEAARAGVRGDGREADLWLARFLADLGGLDGDTLAAATRVEGLDAVATLPALVLRFAEAHDSALAPVADQLAAQLAPRLAEEPGLLPFALAGAGLPNLLVSDDVDAAAAVGARAAGAAEPPRARARGSQRSRARRLVQDLVDGLEGPAPALLRALAGRPEADAATLVAGAGWLRSRQDRAPVEAVIDGGEGEDRRALARARRALEDRHDAALPGALRNEWLRVRPATALAAARLALPQHDGELAMAAVQAGLAPRTREVRSEVAATIAMARLPDMVELFLPRPDSRDAVLMFCRYVQTEQGLAALLELPVPSEEVPRALYAEALGEMADPAAADRLQGIASSWPQDRAVARAVARAKALLGR